MLPVWVARHWKPHILGGLLSTPDVAYPSPWSMQTCCEARILGSKSIIHSPIEISNAGHCATAAGERTARLFILTNRISRAESRNTIVNRASLFIYKYQWLATLESRMCLHPPVLLQNIRAINFKLVEHIYKKVAMYKGFARVNKLSR